MRPLHFGFTVPSLMALGRTFVGTQRSSARLGMGPGEHSAKPEGCSEKLKRLNSCSKIEPVILQQPFDFKQNTIT
ncbi:MAG TPA: hypothetical protein VF690_04540 [Hymenobacter sp.]|jgi:hypothetical protein